MKSVCTRPFAWTGLASFPVLVSGCILFGGGSTEGIPIDPTKVDQIVIGKTTRSEVYKLFGTPHSQFQGRAEFIQGSLRGYFSHTENRILESIDENHYAMLYQSTSTEQKSFTGILAVVGIQKTTIAIHSDELLLLLDKKTNIVTDVAYRKPESAK
jgi:hypothetical protein